MPYFDRFDICEAYECLENDYNVGGMLQERGRNYSVGVQLHRMRFNSRPSLSTDTLSENGKEIYSAAVVRLDLPRDFTVSARRRYRSIGSQGTFNRRAAIVVNACNLAAAAQKFRDLTEGGGLLMLVDSATGCKYAETYDGLIVEISESESIAFARGNFVPTAVYRTEG